MVFTTQCPQCGKILWFSGKLAGTITICPACGGTMRLPVLDAPAPVIPPGETAPPQNPQQIATPAPDAGEDRVPQVVEQSYLTHQAAAAAGEIQVDVDESDLVHWAQPQPTSPPVPPPAWTPEPLSHATPPGGPPQDWPPRHAAPAPATDTQDFHQLPTHEQRRERRRMILQVGATAVGVFLILLGLIWLLTPAHHAADWETANRDQILALKQSAEELALEHNYRGSYESYQELQRLVEGHDIIDATLQNDLESAWRGRDKVYDLAIAAGAAPPPAPTPRPVIATQPSSRPLAATTSAPSSRPRTEALVPTSGPWAHPPPVPATRPADELSDERIGHAVTLGADYLISKFQDGEISGTSGSQYHDGLDCLAVYALMQCGLSTGDPRLDIHGPFLISAIDKMKQLKMNNQYATYSRALRATALALFDRDEDHAIIRQDVDWLLHAAVSGAFTYTDEFPRDAGFAFWDNSNSQYGLLGVWSGAEVGVQVPAQFWRDVEQHWINCQQPDGQWSYRTSNGPARRSMTLAGVASLFVAQDYLDADRYGVTMGRPPFSPALDKGLSWLEDGDNSVMALYTMYDYYALYGLERAGLASGFKYFGAHDWYRDHAELTLKHQMPDGSWPGDNFDSMVDSAYALLFLARGRPPIIMSKLRFDGDWANRPRDAANLARFAAAELERPLNFQVVPTDHDWHDWTDSRILYLASDKTPPITDTQRDGIRSFVQNGGLLLMQADGDSAEFDKFAMDFGRKLFPQYQWSDVLADSPLGSVAYKLVNPPPMHIISNGSRILVMYWPKDVTSHWQLRQEKTNRNLFELGVDLVLYAAGKTELRNRVGHVEIPALDHPAASIGLARLQYDGNWDPEPAAWDRGSRWFGQQTSLGLKIQTVPLENLAKANPPIAHLTGTARLNATEEQVAAVKQYVENGGVLVIDPCGTPGDFYISVRDDLLSRAFPDQRPEPIDPTHPLLTSSSDGMDDISRPAFREFVRGIADTSRLRPLMIRAGKGHVIVLPLDISSGLLDVAAWGIEGYRPDYCLSFLKNLVLWTWDGAKD